VSRGAEARGTRWIGIRLGVVGALLAAAFLVVAGRAVQLQVLQSDKLSSLARDQYAREVEWKPRRGTITDRNGAPLAQDVEADSAFVDPGEFPEEGRRAAIARLARALKADPTELSRRVARGGRFAWAKRRLSPEEAAAARALKLPGVGFAKESRRYYPRRELAAQLVGFVGADAEGLEGVEKLYEEALSGEATRAPGLRDARGMLLLKEAPERAVEGSRVELTIEQGLQLAAERALSRAVAGARATAGMLVAMDPRTGEVLALANAPTFNPNTPRGGEAMRNRSVLDTHEPGSTFKLFTMAGALDAGVLRPGDAFNCESGAWRVGSHVIHDSHPVGWAGPGKIIAASSNICAAKVGQRLGRERLQRTLLAFGFGEKAGTGLPAEPRGQVPFPRAEVALATMSFGHGVTASALQITTAVAAIANGGNLMRPLLVRRVVDPAQASNAGPSHEMRPELVRRAASPAAAAQVARWMELVVHDKEGTGKRAQLDGWRAAGKTGTAQKVDPLSRGYSADKRFSSFVGFAPANDPRIVIGVFIDEPRGEVYGGEVAAPVFKEVAEHALRSMGVPPSEGPAQLALAEAPADDAPRPSIEAALRSARTQPGGEGVAVPVLEGLPARAALKVLDTVELLGETRGTGVVAWQRPPPGTVVERGARVRLELRPRG